MKTMQTVKLVVANDDGCGVLPLRSAMQNHIQIEIYVSEDINIRMVYILSVPVCRLETIHNWHINQSGKFLY